MAKRTRTTTRRGRTTTKKRLGRNYKNGTGPTCGSCGTVGHYRVTCPNA